MGTAPRLSDPLDDRLPVNGSYPLVWFDIFEGNLHVARWRLNRVLSLVGRSARCRVRLPDLSVSSIHCSVVATPSGVWVTDLLSREGTKLRGESVQLARLEEGDLLEVGTYRLRISYQSGMHRTVSGTSESPGLTTRSLQPRPATPPAAPSPVVVVRDDPGTGLVGASGSGMDGQFLLPLVQQFGAMQQEMFDQFQRTMMMVVQAFSTMHQEQAALLREEMQHFRKVTEELQAAHKELRERQAAAAPAPTPTAAASTPAAAPVPPRREPPRATARPFPSGQRPLGSWEVGKTDAPEPSPPVGATAAADLGIGGPAQAEGDEVHDWLTERIANLEQERQSRWQRILSFMRG
jgi:pSer/pThr/pTyr-binding forkhead associated (FHA) protein